MPRSERDHDRSERTTPDAEVQVDRALADALADVERAVDAYLGVQTPELRQTLVDALGRLDTQTAESDAWIAGVTNTAAWGANPKGQVIGETNATPIAEDVSGPEFTAQIGLVRAAKQLVSEPDAQNLAVLGAARETLDSLRRA